LFRTQRSFTDHRLAVALDLIRLSDLTAIAERSTTPESSSRVVATARSTTFTGS